MTEEKVNEFGPTADCDKYCPGWQEWDYCDRGQRGVCADPACFDWDHRNWL